MKKILAAVCLVLILSAPCFAAGVIFEQVIAVTSGVTSITSVPDDVQGVLIQVSRGGAVRMTTGKNTVSSSVGIYLPTYGTYECKSRGEAVAAQFTADIGNTGNGASLWVIGYDYKN